MASPPQSARWMHLAEKGSRAGMLSLVVAGRVLGRRGVHVLLRLVALHYALFHGAVRRASAGYLARALGRPARRREVWRHVLTFAEVTYDRLAFLRGEVRGLELVSHGGFRHLERQRAAGRGALLLGAHLGSFEALRARSEARDLPVHALVYERHARKVNGFLRGVAPELAGRLIEIDPDSPSWILGLQERIEAGQLLALLGDRVGLNDKHATVRFLGGQARFPTGPYLLAALLRCPVYFTVGLYTPPARYDFHCEPLLERVELPREGREEALRDCAQRYAERLEACCRAAPFNWFNFFDAWDGAAPGDAP